MFSDSISAVFRSINGKILKVRSRPLEMLLKISLVMSQRFYKHWRKKLRPPRWVSLKVDNSISMRVDISKAIGAAFYWMGFHELNEWRFLHRFLRPDMVLADVGANQGEFTLFAAKRLTAGQVISFEPVQSLFRQLQENVSLNQFKNVSVFNVGLSNQKGRIPVYMASDEAGENEGLASIFQSADRNRLVEEIELEMLDTLTERLRLSRLDFIKIDVEGAELMVLQGARRTIEKFQPVVMLEITSATYAAAGYSTDDVLNFFRGLNYSFQIISHRGRLETPTVIPSYCNAVFTPIPSKL